MRKNLYSSFIIFGLIVSLGSIFPSSSGATGEYADADQQVH